MGILNATPDSFSDGGRYTDPALALERALELIGAGADLVDIGGESTRPGARPVPADEELARILPILKILKARVPTPVSVDTRKADVARAALDAGADVINDVSALRDPVMGEVVAAAGAGLVLMHMRGEPQTMQEAPRYNDVAGDVARELGEALHRARAAGVDPERTVLDPGIGFAKTAEHNLELLSRLDELASLGRPILLGPSRKAFIGKLLGDCPPERRDVGTAAACVVGLLHGARIFRVHDPQTTREALAVAEAVREAERAQG